MSVDAISQSHIPPLAIAANNLQWLRLIFASQVAVVHAFAHLEQAVPPLLKHFPGVPAFFFVSGFLVYASYRNAPGPQYFANRFLRLYPGLLFVTLGGAVVALVALGWRDLGENVPTYAGWFAAQMTLGQAYNPEHFRSIGVGVINGSLWTLTTEITFYLSVPIIVWLERLVRGVVWWLLLVSFAIYAVGPSVWSEPIYRGQSLYDIIALTPLAWGWMFGFGILAIKHYGALKRVMMYLPVALVPIIAMITMGEGLWFGSSGNRLGLVYFACYAALILWLAFGTPVIRLRPDFSYGIYVWHMPVINLLIVLAIPDAVVIALGATLVMAALSWFLVERPALRLKRRSLMNHYQESNG